MPAGDIPSPFYRVSLKALIFDAKRRLLVVQLEDGMWELPGGGWEHGESMQHCLRREIMEELGVGVDHIIFEPMYVFTGWSEESASGNPAGYRLKLAVEICLNSTDFTLEKGMQSYRFVDAQELARLEMDEAEGGIKTHIQRIWPETAGLKG